MVSSLISRGLDYLDWRLSGRPPKDLWDIYQVVRDPRSYTLVTRPTLVEILAEEGFSDPCPVSMQEWAKTDPEGVRMLEQARAAAAGKLER